jgi:uncharacterized Rmd1/YagE family protein
VVELPSEPQTRPLAPQLDIDTAPEYRSDVERLTKEQRERIGCKRLTAYCIAESFRMKLLAAFLKREHAVTPRIFDEALYVVRTYESS